MSRQRKEIIIEIDENGEGRIDILKDGYNIIETTVYNTRKAKSLLSWIAEQLDEEGEF